MCTWREISLDHLFYFYLFIYIYKSESGWLGLCVLLGDGGLLLCSGGVFFGVRSGGNDIFDIYDCCYVAGAFSLGYVLGSLRLFFATEQRERNRTRTAEYRATALTHPAFYPMSTGGSFSGMKWSGREAEIRVFLPQSRPVLGPTQPPIQWVLGALSRGVGGWV
jgi:hypothetical protein